MIEPDWRRDVALLRVSEKFWKTFFKWPAHARRIPNEMADPQRREILAAVPGGKPGYAAIAFILPDAFADSQGVPVRYAQRFGRGNL